MGNVKNMYKHAFHPAYPDGSLSFIGWARPATGAIPAASELQARLLALLLSGKRELPPNLETVISDEKKTEEKCHHQDFRAHNHTASHTTASRASTAVDPVMRSILA